MKNRIRKLGFAVLATVALTAVACGSAPRTFYYTVEKNPISAARPGTLPGQVGVAKPRASHLLRQDRIVYFSNQNELNFYHYHRWAEPPPVLVQSLIIQELRAAGLFGDVVVYRAQPGLDYLLRGRLLAMEEVDEGSEVRARFSLALELVRQEDNHTLWSQQHQCERAVSGETVETVVTTINACVDETLTQLTRSLGQALSQFEQNTVAEGESKW
jgi:ABC-type uncharacterized transport system auxiliary subunit